MCMFSCGAAQQWYDKEFPEGIWEKQEKPKEETKAVQPEQPAQQPQAVVSPPVPPPSKPEEYAPPSHINKEVPPPTAGEFAPPSKVGEDVTAKAPVVKVALLIPLSGDYTELGKSLLDAAVLAIYDKYSALAPHDIAAKIELLPEDTGDSVEGAEKAAQDSMQAGATLILGPVFSKQVAVVAGSARHKNIPVITFSNNMAVAGDGVYLFGFIPEQQVVRIVQYSLSHNISNIAALVPSNPYGAAIVKQLSAEIRKHNGRVHPIEYYSEDMSSLDNNVGRLARFLQEESGKGQALFIAEGGDKLKTLTETLNANGINASNVQLLGTGLWDDPNLTKIPGLAGGWFASSPPEKYRAFEQHFMSVYSYKPERRASLSYDAVALVVNLALTSAGTGFPKDLIIDQAGYNGPANGIFRFHDDGSIDRGLSVLMITPNGFKTVDPSPTMFNQ